MGCNAQCELSFWINNYIYRPNLQEKFFDYFSTTYINMHVCEDEFDHFNSYLPSFKITEHSLFHPVDLMHFSKHPGLPPWFLRKELFFSGCLSCSSFEEKKLFRCGIATKLKVLECLWRQAECFKNIFKMFNEKHSQLT